MSAPTGVVKPHTVTMTFAVLSGILGGITVDLDIPGIATAFIISAIFLLVAAGVRFFCQDNEDHT